MELKGSKTEKNLMAAFAGESQARNRYTFAASKAKEEGYVQIADVFTETAQNESEHAKRLFKLMGGGEIEITGAFPAGPIGTTSENLGHSAAGENHEQTTMYPGFAKIAREEGFEVIAKVFESIAVAEKQHEKRFRALKANDVDVSDIIINSDYGHDAFLVEDKGQTRLIKNFLARVAQEDNIRNP